MIESGDASDEEAPPCDSKRKDLMQKEWLKVISCLLTEHILRRGAIMVIAQKISLASADLLYHKTKNIILLLCTPTVSIYNHELGIINSSEFLHTKKLWKKGYVLPRIFLARCGGRLPHEVLRTFVIYIPYK